MTFEYNYFKAAMDTTWTRFDRVVKFHNGQMDIDCNVLETMIYQAGAMGKEVFIVSITGISRSGKSFLLGLLQIYLMSYSKVNKMFLVIFIVVK